MSVFCVGVKLGLSHRMKNIGWKVFENMVLRKIFGHEGEVKRRRKLHNGEPHEMYCTPDIIRQMKLRTNMLVWFVVCLEEKRKACKVLTGKPEGKGPSGMLSDRGG